MGTNPMPDQGRARLVLRLATRWPVMKRALLTALVVGNVIGAINHGDKILAGVMEQGDWIKVALTFLAPYSVATYSAVMTLLEQDRARRDMLASPTVDLNPAAAAKLG